MRYKVFIFILVNLYFASYRLCTILVLRCLKISFFLISEKTSQILNPFKKPFSVIRTSPISPYCAWINLHWFPEKKKSRRKQTRVFTSQVAY
jgi:hypothetical protein